MILPHFPLSFFLFSMGFSRGPPPCSHKKEWSYPNKVLNLIFVIIMMIEIQIHNNNCLKVHEMEGLLYK
jgi:hypothetical protein